jgi:glutamate racemase
VIARVLGPGVTLVNPAAQAVAEASRLLPGRAQAPAPHRFLVSGDPEPFYKLATGMLPGAVAQVEQVRTEALITA